MCVERISCVHLVEIFPEQVKDLPDVVDISAPLFREWSPSQVHLVGCTWGHLGVEHGVVKVQTLQSVSIISIFSIQTHFSIGQVIENRFHRRFDGGLVCYQGPQESSFSTILTLFQTCRLVPNCELVENTV